MWTARDQLARRMDTAPGRMLPDAAIIAAARAQPTSPAALLTLPGWTGPAARRRVSIWFAAIAQAASLADADLPSTAAVGDGPPPAARWAERDPVAAARLRAARAAVGAIAEAHSLAVENLLTPDTLRRVCWTPPAEPTTPAVAEALRSRGAREWQVSLVADPIATALQNARPTAAPADPDAPVETPDPGPVAPV
jgi:ribonuclease D